MSPNLPVSRQSPLCHAVFSNSTLLIIRIRNRLTTVYHKRAGPDIITIPARLFAFVLFSFPVLLSWSVLVGHMPACPEARNHMLLFQIHGVHVNDHPFLLLGWSYRNAPPFLFAHWSCSPFSRILRYNSFTCHFFILLSCVPTFMLYTTQQINATASKISIIVADIYLHCT